MENEKEISVDTEELKKETQETVNEVKETIKNVDFKKDAVETKGFIKKMISDPFATIKSVATGEENVFKKAIVIMIVYLAASLGYEIVGFVKYGLNDGILDNIMSIVTSITYPLFVILVLAAVILIFNNKNKKSLTTIISTDVVGYIPVVVNAILDLIEILVRGISIITSPISTALAAISTVLVYFGIKDLFGIEEHKDFIKKYAIIKLVVAVIITILIRIGIA